MDLRLDFLYFIVIFAGSQLWQAVQAMAVRMDYLYFIVIICRESAVAGCTGHGCEDGLSVLHCYNLQGVSCGRLYRLMAVRLDYLYFNFNVIICRKSAVAGCTDSWL
jgi:hypothetical protein